MSKFKKISFAIIAFMLLSISAYTTTAQNPALDEVLEFTVESYAEIQALAPYISPDAVVTLVGFECVGCCSDNAKLASYLSKYISDDPQIGDVITVVEDPITFYCLYELQDTLGLVLEYGIYAFGIPCPGAMLRRTSQVARHYTYVGSVWHGTTRSMVWVCTSHTVTTTVTCGICGRFIASYQSFPAGCGNRVLV